MRLVFALFLILAACETGRYNQEKIDGRTYKVKIEKWKCGESQAECMKRLRREMHTQGEDICQIEEHNLAKCVIRKTQAECVIKCEKERGF